MRTLIRLAHAAAICLVATGVAAQETTSCAPSPGAEFGVVGYQCANCEFSRAKGQRASFSFMAEPVVIATSDDSKLLAGDVIEAVNGKPITTRAGSDEFTYPALGENTVTVRRGRDRQTLRISVAEPRVVCDFAVRRGTGAGVGIGASSGTGSATSPGSGAGTAAGAGASAGYGSGVSGQTRTITMRGVLRPGYTGPLIVVDGVVMDTTSARLAYNLRTGRFGLAVSCEPSCTAATDVDGPLMYTYYKYDGPPPIVAVRTGSPADRAGLRIGDILLRVDGHSILDQDGALALARIDKKETVRLTIRRDGKDLDYVVTVPR